MTFKVDPGLQSLIPPLTEEERAQLEANLLAEGCRDALVLWNGTLLDGHNRYEICERLGLPYDTTEVNLPDRNAAKAWIIRNQFGRRNLTLYVRGELALVLKELVSVGQGARTELLVNSQKVNATEEAAEEAGISPQTMSRVQKIHDHADEDTIAKLRAGETTINREYQKIRQGERRAEKVEQLSIPEPVSGFAPVPLILADPPWRYEFTETGNRKIENQYPTMSLEEIRALPIAEIATEHAVLFMWATSPKIEEALSVIRAWGFTYRTSLVWVKDKIGMGYWARQRHELILVATKGSPPTPAPSARPDSVIDAPRREHSRKPDAVYEMLETMYSEWEGRRVELFARQSRPGWLQWGNEA